MPCTRNVAFWSGFEPFIMWLGPASREGRNHSVHHVIGTYYPRSRNHSVPVLSPAGPGAQFQKMRSGCEPNQTEPSKPQRINTDLVKLQTKILAPLLSEAAQTRNWRRAGLEGKVCQAAGGSAETWALTRNYCHGKGPGLVFVCASV